MQWLNDLEKQILGKSARTALNKKYCRLKVEDLEERVVPTTTLFLDFGDGFTGGSMQATVGFLRDNMNGPDLQTDLGLADADTVTFTSLTSAINFDYNGNGTINSGDASSLKSHIVDLVEQYYQPFDVNVRVAAAANTADVVATLGQNGADASGHNDAYVFVTPIINSGTAIRSTLFGIAAEPDIGVANNRDDVALVFANNLFASDAANATADTALARTAAHEAGHTFRLQHVINFPVGSDDEILARTDVLAQFSDVKGRQNLAFFSRFPLALAHGLPGDQNAYEVLANDPDIGLRAGEPAYVTGTGANDRITLTRLDATHATVTIEAFRLPTYAAADQIGAAFQYTISTANGVHVEGGFGDDQIVVDANLGANFFPAYGNLVIDGMAGIDQLVIAANGVSTAGYYPFSPRETTLDGNLSLRGLVDLTDGTIYFNEFETSSAVTFQDFANVTMYLSTTDFGEHDDHLTITSPAANQTRVADNTGSGELVSLVTSNVGRLTVNAGYNDDASGGNDQITIHGIGGPLTVNTGTGDDTLTLHLDGGMPLPDDGLTLDGGTGVNRLTLEGTSLYNADAHTPTGPNAGTIFLTQGVAGIHPLPNITYANVQSVTDTLSLSTYHAGPITLAPSFVFNGLATIDDIRITDDFGLPAPLDDVIVSNHSDFAPVYFANKPSAYVNGLGGGDTITVDFLTPAAGLTSLTIDGGAEDDTLNVYTAASGIAVTVNGGAGDDTFRVGNTFDNLGTILGSVTVNGGAHATRGDMLTIEDSATVAGQNYTVSAMSVTRGTTVAINYSTLENLTLNGARGGNTFTITGLTATTLVTINGGASANDTIIGPNVSNTWNLRSSGAHSLSAGSIGSVNFSAMENLTGGAFGDHFIFGKDASIAGRLNGGAGIDWADYAAYTSSVNVNLETGSATAVAGRVAGRVSNLENVVGANKAVNTLAGARTTALNPHNNVLIGGILGDSITAGSGNCILIGGAGADTLNANVSPPGFDILIAGTTDYDIPSVANLDILNAIALVWRSTSNANYAIQVALLRDTGVTVGGTVYKLNGLTVHDDADRDTLTGVQSTQSALDWFFANAVNDNPIVNLKSGEVVTKIV